MKYSILAIAACSVFFLQATDSKLDTRPRCEQAAQDCRDTAKRLEMLLTTQAQQQERHDARVAWKARTQAIFAASIAPTVLYFHIQGFAKATSPLAKKSVLPVAISLLLLGISGAQWYNAATEDK